MTAEVTDRAGAPIMSVEGLSFSYGEKQIFRDLTFTIEPGEFVCIVGPSGAGKSTLLQCLAGLNSPRAGVVSFEQAAVTAPPANLTVVFQDYSRSLMPWLSARDNITLPLRSAKVRVAERNRRASDALNEVGLPGVENSYPWELSGGMQQRVAIARALAYRPSMVIMDEPFASVDAQTRADLEDLTLQVKNHLGIAVILVTHDIDEAVYLADRVLVLSGSPATLTDIVPVGLGAERDQILTKERPEFAELRARIYRQIKRPNMTAELSMGVDE
ncbi:ABC transporter ATP-binding protein [Salinibacterium sp. ZJ454]|uniref:ABC transporter ATP-binding protein n=1 Tax=Salinibacterium sp. ZJ454 TaxID=2708339 RepID=UPI0014209DFB|nr:ABC transporter ATP-binding protein [Salinibacterium sp. ZJ454]